MGTPDRSATTLAKAVAASWSAVGSRDGVNASVNGASAARAPTANVRSIRAAARHAICTPAAIFRRPAPGLYNADGTSMRNRTLSMWGLIGGAVGLTVGLVTFLTLVFNLEDEEQLGWGAYTGVFDFTLIGATVGVILGVIDDVRWRIRRRRPPRHRRRR